MKNTKSYNFCWELIITLLVITIQEAQIKMPL